MQLSKLRFLNGRELAKHACKVALADRNVIDCFGASIGVHNETVIQIACEKIRLKRLQFHAASTRFRGDDNTSNRNVRWAWLVKEQVAGFVKGAAVRSVLQHVDCFGFEHVGSVAKRINESLFGASARSIRKAKDNPKVTKSRKSCEVHHRPLKYSPSR
jgi:hypothetical protein